MIRIGHNILLIILFSVVIQGQGIARTLMITGQGFSSNTVITAEAALIHIHGKSQNDWTVKTNDQGYFVTQAVAPARLNGFETSLVFGSDEDLILSYDRYSASITLAGHFPEATRIQIVGPEETVTHDMAAGETELKMPAPFIFPPLASRAGKFDVIIKRPKQNCCPTTYTYNQESRITFAYNNSVFGQKRLRQPSILSRFLGIGSAQAADTFVNTLRNQAAQQSVEQINRSVLESQAIDVKIQDDAASRIQKNQADLQNALRVDDENFCATITMKSATNVQNYVDTRQNTDYIASQLAARTTGAVGTPESLGKRAAQEERLRHYNKNMCSDTGLTTGGKAFCQADQTSKRVQNSKAKIGGSSSKGSQAADFSTMDAGAQDMLFNLTSLSTPAVSVPNEYSAMTEDEFGDSIKYMTRAGISNYTLSRSAANTIAGEDNGTRQYVENLFMELGLRGDTLEDYLPAGRSLSEDGMLELMTTFFVQNPAFFINLQRDEEAVDRVILSLQSIELQLDHKIAQAKNLQSLNLAAMQGMALDDAIQSVNKTIRDINP